MKRLFLKARLQGIWQLLTKPWFMCLTATSEGNVSACYNVNHDSFRLMVRGIDTAYEANEAGGDLLNQANELLKPKKK